METSRRLLLDDALPNASNHDALAVVFHHTEGKIGWRAHVHAADDSCLLRLPWTDQIDRQLVERSEALPFGLGLVPMWWDLDQCWSVEVMALGDRVLVAETESETGWGWSPSPEPTVRVQPDPEARQGRVCTNDVDVKFLWCRAANGNALGAKRGALVLPGRRARLTFDGRRLQVNRPGSDGASQSMETKSHGSTQEVPRRAA